MINSHAGIFHKWTKPAQLKILSQGETMISMITTYSWARLCKQAPFVTKMETFWSKMEILGIVFGRKKKCFNSLEKMKKVFSSMARWQKVCELFSLSEKCQIKNRTEYEKVMYFFISKNRTEYEKVMYFFICTETH